MTQANPTPQTPSFGDRLYPIFSTKTFWASLSAAVIGLVLLFTMSISFSSSLQTGIYLKSATPDSIERGMILSFCVEDDYSRLFNDRGYSDAPFYHADCDRGRLPHIKRVWGIPGDTVEVNLTGIHVNGITLSSHPVISDGEGRLMPVKWGQHIIGEGELWFGSDRPGNVLDSRYQGTVSMADVVGSKTLLFPRDEHPIFARDISRLGLQILGGTPTPADLQEYAALLPLAHAGDHEAILNRYQEERATPTDLLLSSEVND